MRIAIIAPYINRFNGGGERAALITATGLIDAGHHVALVTLAGPACGHFCPRCDIPVFTYNDLEACSQTTKLQTLLLSNDIGVCLLMGSNADFVPWLLAVEGTNIALCHYELTDPWRTENLLWNREDRLTCLSMADRIVLQQELYMPSLPAELRERARIIPNALLTRSAALQLGLVPKVDSSTAPFSANNFLCRRPSVVIASRLVDAVKQVSLCIRAFSLLPESCKHWMLDIYGDGEDKAMLSALVDTLNLHDRVFFHGFAVDITERMAQGQIFAIPSAFEGFPNALLDAMQAGLPSVAFAQCRALRGIIVEKEMGVLAPTMTPESYASALARLMRDENLRVHLAANAYRHLSDYRSEKVLPLWVAVLQECIKEPRKQHQTAERQATDHLRCLLRKSCQAKKKHMLRIVSEVRSVKRGN